MRLLKLLLTPLVGLAIISFPVSAQTISPGFSTDYSIQSLGSITNLPTSYGGLTIRPGETDFLYIGGGANSNDAAVYRVPLIRDSNGQIQGFGSATLFAQTPNIDGGLVFSPTGTMLFTRYSMNEIGQVAVGETSMSSSQPLSSLGVASSVGSLQFVPVGFPGAGNLIVSSYNTSRLFNLPYTEVDGVYTFSQASPAVQISGGPEGILYVPLGSPVFGDTPHLLISAYSGNQILAYEVDSSGLPIPGTQRVMISNIVNPEGATIDPLTGDFLFSSFGAGNQVYRVSGFIPEPSTYALIFGSMSLLAALMRRRFKM